MRLVSAAALACLLAVPALAQDAPTPAGVDFSALTDEQLDRTAHRVDGYGDACERKVPAYDELHRRHPDATDYETQLYMAQTYCAASRRNFADALVTLRKVDKLNPSPSVDQIGLWLALNGGDGGEIIARLRKQVARGDVFDLTAEQLTFANRAIYRPDEIMAFEEVATQIADNPRFAELEPNAQDLIALRALDGAVRAGEPGKVDAALAHIRSPASLLNLLTNRKFETFWPQIERRAGSHLANVTDAYVAWTAQKLAEKPGDGNRAAEYATALQYAGRYEDAAKLASDALGKGDLAPSDAWALNAVVKSLDVLGRTAEADAIFERLSVISPDEHPWVVSFVINRASRLLQQDRFAEALAAVDLARPVAEKYGNDFARFLVSGYRGCALNKLGRGSESATDIERARAEFARAPVLATRTLLCANMREEAVDRLARYIAYPLNAESLSMAAQEARFLPTGAALSDKDEFADLIWSEPRLGGVIEKSGRRLPDRLVPLAYYRRNHLPVPADGE